MSEVSSLRICIAAILLAVATALGAIAAHGLDRYLEPGELANFRTGVEYHFYHGLGLLGLAALRAKAKNARLLTASEWLLVAGIVLFSGSLYLGAFVSLGALSLAAPVGGLCFITAWLLAAAAFWPGRRDRAR